MIIYTDGSTAPTNPGPGGFGVVVFNDDNKTLIDCFYHHEDYTTNNRMEIKAILYALIMYGKENPFPIVYSDSAYCVNTFNNWMFSWAKKDWKKSDDKTPENLDLIHQFYEHWINGYRIDLRKIKGHNNSMGNELADKLASAKISMDDLRNMRF